MANRREFLQSAAALSAAPLAGRAFGKTGSAPQLNTVIFDRRHRAARDFAAVAADLGAPSRAIAGDITDLWKGELLGQWRNKTRPLAGLTERPALFLLERLAWDHGLRVVFEAEHELAADGQARHRILRSGDPGLQRELDRAGLSWPGVLADALMANRQVRARDFRPTDAAMFAHRGEPTKLYSWIIAARSARA